MTAEPWCWGGGGVSHPLQLTTGLLIKSVTTSPTLAGERVLLIPKVSILSEQIKYLLTGFYLLKIKIKLQTVFVYFHQFPMKS